MNFKLQLTRAFILSLLCAIAFGLIAYLISAHRIAQFDSTISSFIQSFETPTLTSVMEMFSFIGSGLMVVLLSLFVLFYQYKFLKHRSELVLFIAVVAGSGIMNQVLKSLFHRNRPSLHQLVEAGGFSFPSGHSMEAAAFYGILTYLLWRHIDSHAERGILVFLSTAMIILIGVSRIYLGVHYPSDVLGGYIASGFWLFAAIWVHQMYKESQSERSKNE
ncbi:phosphatase PAP2 family protein [Brevibacillus ginsengisoli]|uniref:phosphatase PAP2 family protein n=1 Tax=Brevibacillus ginsengisoli TaxID=363854 RepID=UPI003CEEE389